MDQAFRDAMTAGYALDEPAVTLGSPMPEGELLNEARVRASVAMLNRHGLIAGATGTGKAKTLQLIAGQLSKLGVPVSVSDIKGDVNARSACWTRFPSWARTVDGTSVGAWVTK